MSNQYNSLQRRKNELRRKAANFGYSTPPEVATELQDIDQALHLIDLVNICRKRLETLVKQSYHFGEHVPAHIKTEIDSTRQIIANYKLQASKLHHPLDDHPLDNEEPVYKLVESEPESLSVTLKRIEWKLDQVLIILHKEK